MTVCVCPHKDIECGDKPTNWCQECPKREEANKDTLIADLQNQVKHWMSNHATEVERARLLKERPDLPIERIRAYENYQKLCDENQKLQRELDDLKEKLKDPYIVSQNMKLGIIANPHAGLEKRCMQLEAELGIVENNLNLVGWGSPVYYTTDDRDVPVEEHYRLKIYPGGNGDWYVSIVGLTDVLGPSVRLSTSGGAQFHAPGLTVAISRAYRALLAKDPRNLKG